MSATVKVEPFATSSPMSAGATVPLSQAARTTATVKVQARAEIADFNI
jgi:hypothetical protein